MSPLPKPSRAASASAVPRIHAGASGTRTFRSMVCPPCVVAIVGLVVLAGCREDAPVSPEGGDGTRAIRLLLERGSLPDSSWMMTDSVKIVVATTDGVRIMDGVVGFRSDAPGIEVLRAPVDRGVVVEASGWRDGIGIWNSSVALPPSATPQIATLLAGNALASANDAPTLGTQDVPEVEDGSLTGSPLLVSGMSTSEDPWNGSDTFDRPVTVKLSTLLPDAEIRYTLDGSMPTLSSSPYSSSGILIDSSRTLKAVVFDKDHLPGDSIWSRKFVLMARPVRIAYREEIASFGVALSCSTSGVAIRYRLDGAVPEASDSVYRDSLEFGPYDDSIWMVGVAFPLDTKIQPSSPVRRKIGMELPWKTGIEYGTLRDERDGRTYRIVDVAGKRWMAQNLDYRTDASRCLDDEPDGCVRYGRLYTWVEAMGLPQTFDTTSWTPVLPHRGVCPEGWHLPSDAEWADLAKVSVNGAMKSTRGWILGGGQDLHGFRILPSGRRYEGDTYVYAGYSAYFWSASGSDAYSALGSYQCSGCDRMYRSDFRKNYGMAVRCVAN